MKYIFIAFALIITTLTHAPAQARVWYVEKDGSGDFVELQPAALAAASGDTIQIGPGRFDQQVAFDCYGEDYLNILAVGVEELTILGSGPDQTIIGPEEPWVYGTAVRRGVSAESFCGPQRITIKNIGFENLSHAIQIYRVLPSSPPGTFIFFLDNCNFTECRYDIISDANICQVLNCHSESSLPWTNFFGHPVGPSADLVEIRNCTKVNSGPNCNFIGIGGCEKVIIEDCNFQNLNQYRQIGLFSNAFRTEIRRTTIDGAHSGIYAGLYNLQNRELIVEDCDIRNCFEGVTSLNGNTMLDISNTQFSEMRDASLSFYNVCRGGKIYDCDLAKGEQFVVYFRHAKSMELPLALNLDLSSYVGNPDTNNPISPHVNIPANNNNTIVDMTNNYWGTTDPDSIQAWIQDKDDDPSFPYSISWYPFLNEEVSVQEKSLGSFRSMFR